MHLHRTSAVVRRGLAAAAVCLATLGITPSAADATTPDPLVNGGFEADPTGGWDAFWAIWWASAGQQVIPGWEVVSGDVHLIPAAWYGVPYVRSGAIGLDLNGCEAGTIRQTFATPIGAQVDVAYWANGPAGIPWTVIVDSAGTELHRSNETLADGDLATWAEHGVSGVVATATSTTITLASGVGGCEGVHLDDFTVEITEVDTDLNDDGITDTAPPAQPSQCKSGAWASFNNPSFRNQGDCVSFVATRGRNAGRG